jgi:hypothetical protein
VHSAPSRPSRGAPHDIAASVLRLAQGGIDGGFDAALIGDPLLPVLRTGGCFVSASQARLPTAERAIRVAAVRGAPDGAQLAEILERLATGRLTTRVAGVLSLGHAAEAHRQAEAGASPGRSC